MSYKEPWVHEHNDAEGKSLPICFNCQHWARQRSFTDGAWGTCGAASHVDGQRLTKDCYGDGFIANGPPGRDSFGRLSTHEAFGCKRFKLSDSLGTRTLELEGVLSEREEAQERLLWRVRKEEEAQAEAEEPQQAEAEEGEAGALPQWEVFSVTNGGIHHTRIEADLYEVDEHDRLTFYEGGEPVAIFAPGWVYAELERD